MGALCSAPEVLGENKGGEADENIFVSDVVAKIMHVFLRRDHHIRNKNIVPGAMLGAVVFRI